MFVPVYEPDFENKSLTKGKTAYKLKSLPEMLETVF